MASGWHREQGDRRRPWPTPWFARVDLHDRPRDTPGVNHSAARIGMPRLGCQRSVWRVNAGESPSRKLTPTGSGACVDGCRHQWGKSSPCRPDAQGLQVHPRLIGRSPRTSQIWKSLTPACKARSRRRAMTRGSVAVRRGANRRLRSRGGVPGTADRIGRGSGRGRRVQGRGGRAEVPEPRRIDAPPPPGSNRPDRRRTVWSCGSLDSGHWESSGDTMSISRELR